MAKTGYLPNETRRQTSLFEKICDAVNNHRWALVIAYSMSLNVSLDDDYRLKVSSDEYDKAFKSNLFFECPVCKKEVPATFEYYKYSDHIKAEHKPFSRSNDDVLYWTHCDKKFSIENLKVIDRTQSRYETVGIIPEPPRKDAAVQTRDFEAATEKWSHIVLVEISAAMSKWRREYSSADEDDDDNDYTGEEDL